MLQPVAGQYRPVFPCLWLIIAILSSTWCFGQKNVSVNLTTGTAHVSIPVYTVQRGDVSIPVSLEYGATGIRVTDMQSVLGTGWQLNTGGAISRDLRDLPDDVKTDNGSNSRLGWMHNSNGSKINNFTVSNDNNPATCTDETADINYLNGNFSDNSDLEPDIFNVQAPGLNCQLVYDNIAGVFRTIPYRDYQISYAYNAAQTSIISFTITNDKGIIYTFDIAGPTTQTTSSTSPGTIPFYKRPYTLYQNGVTYNSRWYLSKVQDANGNYITLGYSTFNTITTTTPMQVVLYDPSTIFGKDSALYFTTQATTLQYPYGIYSFDKLTGAAIDAVTFSYTSTTDLIGYLVGTINLNNGRRTMSCTYNKIPGHKRDFLTSFGEAGCSANGVSYNSNLYTFAYNGINFTSPAPPYLADFSLNGNYQDYWGYFNAQNDFIGGSRVYVYPDNASYPNLERYRIFPIPGYTGTSYTIDGTNSTVDPSIFIGTLNQIAYPTGGNTTMTYDYNDFYDVSAAATFQGGGIRVKQIVDNDGISSANNITHNYIYTDPSTSLTTGKPVAMPALAFTIPYTGTATGADYWNYSTIRIFPGASNQNEAVLYGKVTVQQAGAGKQVHEFSTPGTFWDATASPVAGGSADWSPVTDNAGRSISGSSCPAIGSLKNAKYSYPFVPNANYDFERGLLTRVTAYNEAGNIVSQISNTYVRTSAVPLVINALKFDINSTAQGYGKYQIYANTSELIASSSKIVYDINNSTQDPGMQLSGTTNYYYTGVNHKLPTQIQTTNTDGTIDRKYLKYTKDYPYANDDLFDAAMGAIKALTLLNVNVPIETYNTVTRSGVEKTVRADLVKYAAFSSGQSSPANIYLPAQRLHFISSTGISSFPASYNNSGSFVNYSGYVPSANLTAYNSSGYLLTSDDNYNNVQSQIIDDKLLLPVATILNAKYNEISYTNFDGSEPKYGLTVANSTYNSSVSRTGTNSLSISASSLLSGTLNLKNNAKKYVFSCWTNAASAGALTISLYTNSGTLFSTQTQNFAASGAGWNYYEQKVSTNGLSGSFTIKVQTNTGINIDDILFYPESSEVTTFAYDPYKYFKTAETNTNGVSKYYLYDQYYRLQYVLDQDKNIVLKKTYASANSISNGLGATGFSYSPSSSIRTTTAVTFTGTSASVACTPGTYYSWNFGDGTSSGPSLTNTNPVHTYSAAGIYSPTFTVSNAIYGTQTATLSLSVAFTVNGCQSGVYGFTPPNGTVLTNTCSGQPSNTSNSYFTITGITGAPVNANFTYQWQRFYWDTGHPDSQVWTNISGTSINPPQLVIPFVASSFRPYDIKCIVTDTNTGLTGVIGPFSVSVGGQ